MNQTVKLAIGLALIAIGAIMATSKLPLGITCYPSGSPLIPPGAEPQWVEDPYGDPYGGYWQYCETTTYPGYTATVTETVGGVVTTRTVTTEKTVVVMGTTTHTITSTVNQGITTTLTLTTTVIQGVTTTSTITGIGGSTVTVGKTVTITTTEIKGGTTVVSTITVPADDIPAGDYSKLVLPIALIGAGGLMIVYSRRRSGGG